MRQVDHDDDPGTLLTSALEDYLTSVYEEKSEMLGSQIMRTLESQVMLRIMDTRWMAHLQDMDYLRAGIGLRAYGQRDPLTEYREGSLCGVFALDERHVRGLSAHAPSSAGRSAATAGDGRAAQPACWSRELLESRGSARGAGYVRRSCTCA